MSTNKMSTNQKFCKVCQDAGKSEAEFRSHFIRETRDPNSKITCPTLLAIECRYCYKRGHTLKYCSAFKNKTNKKTEQPTKKTEKPLEKKQTNAFSCLYADSDDEPELIRKFTPRSPSSSPPPLRRHEDFPELCAPAKHFQPINYAFALIHPEEAQGQSESQGQEQKTEEKYITKILPLPTYAKKPMKSWADDSSDEEEEYHF
jgi:hypothetical protein